MGRKFAPFEVVVHFTGSKGYKDIQRIIDEFYIKTIEQVLSESMLSEQEQIEVLDRLAKHHRAGLESREV
jgi:hypothetical protein